MWYNGPVSGRRTKWTQSHPHPKKTKKETIVVVEFWCSPLTCFVAGWMHDGPWNRRRRCYQLVYVPAPLRSDNSQRQYRVRRPGSGEYSPPFLGLSRSSSRGVLSNTALLLLDTGLMVTLKMLIIIVLIINYMYYCGLVVRVSGYRSRCPGFDSRRYQIFWEVVGLERGPPSLVRIIEELLERKVAASV
jgi:hypothetical protein